MSFSISSVSNAPSGTFAVLLSAERMNLYFPSCLTAQTTVVILDSSTSFSSFRPLVLILVFTMPLSSLTVSEWQRIITVTSLRISSALLTIPHPCCARSVHAERLSPPCIARILISSPTIIPLSVSITTYLIPFSASSLSIWSSAFQMFVKLSVLA